MTKNSKNTRLRSAADVLASRLDKRTARLGVIGLGYVGLPLAVELAQAGFEVFGVDIDESRVKQLNQGRSYIQDVPTADVPAADAMDASAPDLPAADAMDASAPDLPAADAMDARAACTPRPTSPA
jgi:nucleoside-diphosphate-sugar epimerase